MYSFSVFGMKVSAVCIQALGFVRDKRLSRYYLNGVDAYRLKLLLPLTEAQEALLLLKSQKEAGGAVDGDDSEASMD